MILGPDVLVYPLGVRGNFRVDGRPAIETAKVAERHDPLGNPVVAEAHQRTAGI